MGTALQAGSLTVSRITSDADLHAVFRLRYDVYIKEQGKPVPWVDHRQGTYSDSSDKFARRHFAVRNGDGEIVASVRAHTEPSPTIKRYMVWNAFSDAGWGPLYFSSKFVVRQDYRMSRAAKLLIKVLTDDYLSLGAQFSLLHCAPALVPLYARMGFVNYAPEFYDPFSGRQCPMGVPTGADLTGARHGDVFGTADSLPEDRGAAAWFAKMIVAKHFHSTDAEILAGKQAGITL